MPTFTLQRGQMLARIKKKGGGIARNNRSAIFTLYPPPGAARVLLRLTQIARRLARRQFSRQNRYKHIDKPFVCGAHALCRRRFYRFIFSFRRLGKFKFASNLTDTNSTLKLGRRQNRVNLAPTPLIFKFTQLPNLINPLHDIA